MIAKLKNWLRHIPGDWLQELEAEADQEVKVKGSISYFCPPPPQWGERNHLWGENSKFSNFKKGREKKKRRDEKERKRGRKEKEKRKKRVKKGKKEENYGGGERNQTLVRIYSPVSVHGIEGPQAQLLGSSARKSHKMYLINTYLKGSR